MPEAKNRAKLLILNHIFRKSVCISFGNNNFRSVTEKDCFEINYFRSTDPPLGSLVILESAPSSKWYLSWLISIEKITGGDRIYLLESIEDGALCNWSNVEIGNYSKEITDKHPEWRWTDSQFDFDDRWNKAFKHTSHRAMWTEFHEDGGVTVKLREMFTNNVYSRRILIPFKKITLRELKAVCSELILKIEKENKESFKKLQQDK